MKNATKLHKAYSLGLEDVARDAKEIQRALNRCESLMIEVENTLDEVFDFLSDIEREMPNLEDNAPYGFNDIERMLHEAESDAQNATMQIQDTMEAFEKMGLS